MEPREWSEILEDPKVVTGCIVIVSIIFLAIAVGYYLGWGMFFMIVGMFLFWLAYRVRQTLK